MANGPVNEGSGHLVFILDDDEKRFFFFFFDTCVSH